MSKEGMQPGAPFSSCLEQKKSENEIIIFKKKLMKY
jgi:hypothetical protein